MEKKLKDSPKALLLFWIKSNIFLFLGKRTFFV